MSLFELTLGNYCILTAFPRSSERVRKLLVSALNASAPIDENQFIASARAIVPQIQHLVTRMGKMVKLNCSVHVNTYNIIIAEAARAKGGA